MVKPQSVISLYKNEESPCSYLPGEFSSSLFANPFDPPNWSMYELLIQKGFRRSGDLIYKPDCRHCRQCISVRLKVCDFKPNRRYRRTIKANSDLTIRITDAHFDEEYYRLYRLYLSAQHADGEMADHSESDFENFLLGDWANAFFLELRKDQRLISVAVTDHLNAGLSAVYTFYDPNEKKRSLGIYSILSQIEYCRELALPHLYLGYWIKNCRKMAYKTDFQPLEYFVQNDWQSAEEFLGDT